MSLRAEVADHSLRSRLLENSPRAQINGMLLEHPRPIDNPFKRFSHESG